MDDSVEYVTQRWEVVDCRWELLALKLPFNIDVEEKLAPDHVYLLDRMVGASDWVQW